MGTIRDLLGSSSEESIWRHEARFVAQVLRDIPDGCRIPLLMFYRDGVSVEDIAWRLDTTSGDVSARLARGREMFCEYVEGRIASVLDRKGLGNDSDADTEVQH